MNKDRDCHNGVVQIRVRSALWIVAVLMCLCGRVSHAKGLITADYTLNWDQDVTRTETETTRTWDFKHILDLKYEGFLSPIVQNEIILKIEQEIQSDADPKKTTKIFPEINLSYKGSYWNAGAKRTIEDSDEPGVNTKIADSYFVEVFFEPPRATLPDLKAKYTLDKDFEAESTDTTDQDFTLSTVYQPMKWLEFKGDYNRKLGEDRLNADSDTEDETISGTVAIRHILSSKIKVNTEFRTEVARQATLLDAGGAKDQEEDQTHTWKNTIAFRPFRDTTIDGSYDFDLKQSLVSGEHEYNKNWKAEIGQKVSLFDLRGSFNRSIVEARHTEDDNVETEDSWVLEARVKPSKFLDLSARYEKTDTEEVHAQDPALDTTSGTVNRNASWSGEITPFWKASASYDKTDTSEEGKTTQVDTTYSFKSTFDFKAIELLIDPTYDITNTEDRVSGEETKTNDFRFKFSWTMFSTNNMVGKVDHTYGRKTDTTLSNAAENKIIERTDDSTVNLTWSDPFPGWTVAFDVVRTATDTSGDDQPPSITSTFGFKVDYTHEHILWNMSYKYDKKSLEDDAETFDLKVGWVAPTWDVSVTYKFDKTFSEELDEKQSIGIEFKYNL